MSYGLFLVKKNEFVCYNLLDFTFIPNFAYGCTMYNRS